MRNVLVDAGPIIAALDRNDARHAWARARLAAVEGRIATVWPALTEAAHILAYRRIRPDRLVRVLQADGMEVASQDQEDFESLWMLLGTYHDLPMDLADAALVHAYHRDRYDAIMTTDVRDFSIYRIGGRPLRLITPAP